jgi:hypothetical protein
MVPPFNFLFPSDPDCDATDGEGNCIKFGRLTRLESEDQAHRREVIAAREKDLAAISENLRTSALLQDTKASEAAQILRDLASGNGETEFDFKKYAPYIVGALALLYFFFLRKG